MRNETTNTAVPKLRFPEFEEAGDWEIKELGKLGKFTGGGTPSKENAAFWQGNIPWISSSDISEESIQRVKIARFISDEALKESATKLIPGNSILLVSRVGVGKLAITTQAVCTSQDFTNFTPSKDDLTFLAYYLKTQSQVLLSYSQGMAIKGFTKDDVSTLKLFVPCLAEQQKIAATLSSLDDLLTAHSAKLTALQAHKRGLMQGLFPAEGETVPKLRFPAFRDEWQKNSLANLTDLLSGYAFQSAFFSASGKRLLTPKNFTRTGYASFNNGNTKYTTEPFDSKYICKEGDLLLLLTDLTPSCELLGKPVLLTKNDGEVLLNQRIVKVIPKSDVEIDFLFHFFSTDAYHKRIRETASGSTVRHSSNKIIASTELYLPSKEEQRKIADIFSSLNDRITAQSQQIEALKLHKKGLMQGLFPAAAEPTA